MQLLSLSISGFKSFAKPTKLDFAQGITCVVGPNGCGKSNVVDSLRWVLGEQRSAVLRSDRMESVIFNGTAARNPAGLAEVKIVLDNNAGRLNVPYAEVEIARRLYRDGTSEYLMNNNECRLKDITDILHDSGMGPNLYTILELKMVEEILREDGEGRRALFEEAAGVAKYKLRRRQALQKLKQTEDDLLRLADIVSEVERQVNSLKRQAMRAKRYTELSAQLHALDSALAYREYVRLRDELTPLELAVKQSSASSEAVKAAIRAEEARVLELRTAEVDVEKETTVRRKELADVVAQIAAAEAEEAGLRARDQAARQTIERAKREKQLLSDKRALLESRLAQLAEAQTGYQEQLDVAERRVAEAGATLDVSEAQLREIESKAQAHATMLSDLRLKVLQCQRESSQVALSRADLSRKELLQNELKTIDSERVTAQSKLNALLDQFTIADEAESNTRKNEARLQEELSAKQAELKDLEEKSRMLASLIEAVQSKLDLLATLEQKGPRSHQALRTLKSKPVQGLMELLGDTIDVQESYRRAFQAALGPAAYYYLTESVESALNAMDLLRSEKAGQTTFIPVTEFSDNLNADIQAPDGSIGTALSLLNGQAANPVVRHFLDHVVIVENWEAATALYPWARDNHCMLVTLNGQWIDRHGMLFGGADEQDLPVDLGLAHQMSELRDRLKNALADRENTTVALRSHRSDLARLEQELAKVRRELDQILRERSGVREQQVKFETRIASLDERTSANNAQILDLDEKTVQSNQSLEKAQAASQVAETELKAAETSGGDLNRQVFETQKATAAEREHKHSLERERDAVKHQIDLMNADANRLTQSIEEIAEGLTAAEKNAEQAANELVALETRLKELDQGAADKYRQRDELAAEADKAGQKLDEVRNQIADQERRLHDLREAHSGELEGERRIEVEVARLRGELDALVHNTNTQFNFDITSEQFTVEHPEVLTTETSTELLQECKQKIERLGPVNPLAIEEYAQENARLDSMRQRDDLLKAKKILEETIARINETAQARFLHTFEAVRTHFQRLFQEFFVAGEADLILSGSDLLEADITLWANPSGKRLKSLSLMSGGEKTMTAIALLFALYHVKPSPFCVFDEVDAPLDDANIDRFNRVIRMHAENTQFILITHNRRTMEIADNLYGVTMEEEGISKLVSVRLLSSVA